MKYNKISQWKYEVYNDDNLFIGTLISYPTDEWMYRPIPRIVYLTAIEMRRIYNKLNLLNKK